MKDTDDLLTIWEKELIFTTARSGGSGGQHVNKVETKVTLNWEVDQASNITLVQKKTIKKALGNKINKVGVLVLSCDTKRSQLKNKDTVIKRWKSLIKKALQKKKIRKPTKPTVESIRKRRESKAKHAVKKALRKNPKI